MVTARGWLSYQNIKGFSFSTILFEWKTKGYISVSLNISHFWQSSCLSGTQYHICPLQNAIFTSIYQRPEVLEALLDHFRSPGLPLVDAGDGALWLAGAPARGGRRVMRNDGQEVITMAMCLLSSFWAFDPPPATDKKKSRAEVSGLDENRVFQLNFWTFSLFITPSFHIYQANVSWAPEFPWIWLWNSLTLMEMVVVEDDLHAGR